MSPRALPGRTINEVLSAQLDREVIKIETLPINPGQAVHLRLVGGDSPWRQGVRLATQGGLSANGVAAPQLDFWRDTAPPVVEVTCESTDGLLRIYNIWQSGRRPGVEFQSHTSGMLVEILADGSRRYRCNDIGLDPSFEKLVFEIAIV